MNILKSDIVRKVTISWINVFLNLVVRQGITQPVIAKLLQGG